MMIMKHPVGGKTMEPVFLGAEKPEIKEAKTVEPSLQNGWHHQRIHSSRNLSMCMVTLFGIGIIDPVDDVRIGNPASNLQLLDALANRFTEYNYDFKKLVRHLYI